MKKKKLLRAMELADEKYVAEADPEKHFKGARLENKVIDPKKKIRKWSLLAACLAVAVVAVNLALFIPFGTTPPDVSQYADSEYYGIIQKLNEITFKAPKYKNNFELLVNSIPRFVKEQAGDAFPEAPGMMSPGAADGYFDVNNKNDSEDGVYQETTDNQVSGVTEADRIKRSDKYIYYLCDRQLYVYSIEGENSALAGAYQIGGFDRGYVNEWEFYLSRDCKTVTLVAPNYNTQYDTACVTLVSLDVTDPANITEKGRVSVTGGHISTRVVDGKILLMTNFRVVLTNSKPDFDNEFSFLPSIDSGNGFEVLPVDDIITPENLSSARYTVVSKLDEATLGFEDATALLSYSEEVYVSKDKIFATHGYSENAVVDDGKSEITKKMTDISAISYGDTEMTYLGTATVEGYVKDQYSLDEYEGILRVVTTTDAALQKTTVKPNEYGIVSVEALGTNANLYCISLDSYEIISSVVAFAPEGETVKSVRFDGEDAYVCTAIERKDPVFFFDLSDVNNITYKETGTIEGFSTSLVNFGNGYLLGIGTGSNWGSLKIEIYEESEDGVVSVCAYELENSEYSEDYKSYYINRAKQMVGLGVTTYGNGVYVTDTSAQRYLLVQFDGYEIHEILNVELYGDNTYKRGVLVDEYMYMFSGSEFKVEKIS